MSTLPPLSTHTPHNSSQVKRTQHTILEGSEEQRSIIDRTKAKNRSKGKQRTESRSRIMPLSLHRLTNRSQLLPFGSRSSGISSSNGTGIAAGGFGGGGVGRRQRKRSQSRWFRAVRTSMFGAFVILFGLLLHLGMDDSIAGASLTMAAAGDGSPGDAGRMQQSNLAASSSISSRSPASLANSNGQSHEPPVVAYAISLIKCGDKQSTPTGLTDAATVLRHSVHLQSMRNPSSGSKYDYKMYAIVHTQAEACSHVLRNVGFELIVVDPPIQQNQIRGEHLKQNIHKEWCCGSDEFVKLYAYTIPQDVIVHVDIDFAFYQPMDVLYDAILHDKDSDEGRAARSQLLLERPSDPLPDRIDAFVTRDWPQVIPGRKAMFQAGFLVARRDPSVVDELKNVILEGNYTGGFQLANGWGGAGYGGYVGSMAMQGLMAYYYDMIRPNTAVELNQCRFNHMGMDIRYRHAPNFHKRKKDKVGKCRNDNPHDICEDCTVTDVNLIYNVHYTECRKPWNCIGAGSPGGRLKKPADSIDTDAGNFEHCMELIQKWHETRLDFEDKLFAMTEDKMILKGRDGDYKKDIFKGHCTGEGGENYQPIQASDNTWRQVMEIY